MDNTNVSVYQVIQNFVNSSDHINEEEKKDFLAALDSMSQGTIENVEKSIELNNFLESEITQLEDAAILAEDAEQINMLADLRNARLKLKMQLLGTYKA